MNTDIRIETSFPGHPKTVKLTKKLGPQGPLSLIYLWIFAAQNKPTGSLDGMDIDDIAIAAQWPKDPKVFVDALCYVRFISCHEGTYQLHDWKDHNPFASHAPERSEKARKAAAARWGVKDARECDEHKQAMPLAPFSNAPSPAPNPAPNPSPKPAGEHPEQPVDNSETPLPPFEEPEEQKAACFKKPEALPPPSKPPGPKPPEQPHGNTHGERWTKKQGDELEGLMNDIRDRYGLNYHGRVENWARANYNRKNPGAMLHCLQRLIVDLLAGKEIKVPERWLDALLNGNKEHPGENGRFEAEESARECEQYKRGPTQIGAILAGMR